MANPILEMLDRRNRQSQQLQQNPLNQQVSDYVAKHGGDPKSAFYNACQERGVNPNDILRLIGGVHHG